MDRREKLIKSEIIEMFDTSKEALRHYENVGLLHPEVNERNYRFYGFDELTKLRQLFVLKDLGFQLDEMKSIMDKEVSGEHFARLLDKHNNMLMKRIVRYKEIQNNISMVLKLLEDETHSITFNIKNYGDRMFLMLDSEDIADKTPKGYYDEFKNIIQEEYYNERVLVSCYDYSMLDYQESGFSKLCFDIGDLSADLYENDNVITKEYGSGLYLSVFYVYSENVDLGDLKRHIDNFIMSNHLVIEDDLVLEFEHPELGMVLGKDEELYEIQLKVRVKNG